MNKIFNDLLNKLSHDNVIYFRILPTDNEYFSVTAEDKALIDEILQNNEFKEDCFAKVFENDIFLATAVSIYLFKLGTTQTTKPSLHLEYLKPLYEIICSIFEYNQISAKKYKQAIEFIVGELFISRFALVYPKFDDNFKDYLPFTDEGYVTLPKQNIEEFFDEGLKNFNLFYKQIDELSFELQKTDYYIFPHGAVWFPKDILEDANTRFNTLIYKMATILLSRAFDKLSDDYIDIYEQKDQIVQFSKRGKKNESITSELQNRISYLLDFAEKFNRTARMIWMSLTHSNYDDRTIKKTECFINANILFDKVYRYLCALSQTYGLNQRYDIRYKIEIQYYKIYILAFLGNEVLLNDDDPSLSKDDEIRANALALLKLTSDEMRSSFVVATRIAKYSISGKQFVDYHFVTIKNDINKEYQRYVDRTCEFLEKLVTTRITAGIYERALEYNSLFKEILLDYALKNQKYEIAKKAIYAKYIDSFDVPTMYIVRKYNTKAYHTLISKMTEDCKRTHVKTLGESDSMSKLYGKDFCDELSKLCSSQLKSND